MHEVDLLSFDEELEATADQWMKRDRSPSAEDLLELLSRTEDPDQATVVTPDKDPLLERLTAMKVDELKTLLGFTRGGPLLMRQHMAADPAHYGETPKDEEIPSKTKLFELKHHQLVALAYVLCAIRGKSSPFPRGLVKPADDAQNYAKDNWKQAPEGVKLGYERIPGVLLADAVGLGKTFTAMALIAHLTTLAAMQAKALKDKNFVLPDVIASTPENPCAYSVATIATTHLSTHCRENSQSDDHPFRLAPHYRAQFPLPPVAVPAGQGVRWYLDEGLHVQTPVGDLGRYSTGRRLSWPAGTRHFLGDHQRKASHLSCHSAISRYPQILGRMAAEVLDVDGKLTFPTIPKGQPLPLLSRCFTTMVNDEAHDVRTKGKNWRGVYAAAQLAAIKCLMTATPLVEGTMVSLRACTMARRLTVGSFAQDLLNLARIMRPPKLTEVQEAKIAAQIDGIKKLKNKLLPQRAAEIEGFVERTSIHEPEDPVPGPSTEHDITPAVAAFDEDAADRLLLAQADRSLLKDLHCVSGGFVIRRDGDSLDCNGEAISTALPPLTVVHAALHLSIEELEHANILSSDEDITMGIVEKKTTASASVRSSLGFPSTADDS